MNEIVYSTEETLNTEGQLDQSVGEIQFIKTDKEDSEGHLLNAAPINTVRLENHDNSALDLECEQAIKKKMIRSVIELTKIFRNSVPRYPVSLLDDSKGMMFLKCNLGFPG